eukprot:TRINITY_DN16_c3_g1_i5.p2 TRINITY_DN16_c3_g1~~TRINITY_DN16_c3_g1_i5.p2  ORF type:complete len:201 (+),score=-15.03 TRINITY_DN16_c3_g1_i5:583-1185(+)
MPTYGVSKWLQYLDIISEFQNVNWDFVLFLIIFSYLIVQMNYFILYVFQYNRFMFKNVWKCCQLVCIIKIFTLLEPVLLLNMNLICLCAFNCNFVQREKLLPRVTKNIHILATKKFTCGHNNVQTSHFISFLSYLFQSSFLPRNSIYQFNNVKHVSKGTSINSCYSDILLILYGFCLNLWMLVFESKEKEICFESVLQYQ